MAASNGLKTVAIIDEDALFPKAAGKGAVELAKQKGMQVVHHETYAKGTKDFSAALAKIKASSPDVFGMSASTLSDFIIVARQMKEQDVNVKMFGTSGAVAEFQKELGKVAEFSYGTSAWEPTVPYPGVKEFVEDYKKEFDKPPSFHAAGAYSGCQLFVEAARLAGSLDSDKLREQLLKLKTKTVFADYAVDERGVQTANKGLLIQWQDSVPVVVWPGELASAKAAIPNPAVEPTVASNMVRGDRPRGPVAWSRVHEM